MASAVLEVLPSFGQYLAAQSGRAIERLATTELFGSVGRLAGLRRLEDPAFLDRLNMAQRVSTSAPAQVFTSISGAVQSALTVTGFLAAAASAQPGDGADRACGHDSRDSAERAVARRRTAMINGISHGERRQYFYPTCCPACGS